MDEKGFIRQLIIDQYRYYNYDHVCKSDLGRGLCKVYAGSTML